VASGDEVLGCAQDDMSGFQIHDLRERPQHADGVAQRIWRAFWKHHGTPYAQIRDGLDAILGTDKAIPFGLVAEISGEVRGNCLVIDNDEDARPNLTPWLAALWVDEAMRGQGIAAALLDEGAQRTAARGVPRLYLVSRPALQGFYTRLGWRIIEENVGSHRQTLYVRELGAVPSRP
jgi:predicted N-acetyltransferase YhbS